MSVTIATLTNATKSASQAAKKDAAIVDLFDERL
jgi:hypothetical protein